ncbi:MAG: Gfo/Idh/MocA family protein [Myxococcota bacterium]
MADRLKVGIAGYGTIGALRHAACDRQKLFHVVAACDRNFTRRTTLSTGIPALPSLEELFELDLDVLFVCMPNDLASKATISGLERGLHVFCEKPPGRTVADILRVREVESRHPELKLQYGFNHRYHESVKAARELIETGSLGSIINLRGIYGKSAFIPWPRTQAGEGATRNVKYWRTSRAVAGGGILLDQGIHMVDLMNLFVRERFTQIHAFVDNSYWNHDVEDNAYALMRSESGIVAMLHSSATLWQHRFSLDISLTEGVIRLSGILSGTKSYGEEVLTVLHRQQETNGMPTEHTTRYVQDRSWDDEVQAFARAILLDEPIQAGNSADALASMETVHCIYESDPTWAERYGATDAAEKPGAVRPPRADPAHPRPRPPEIGWRKAL